MKNETMLEIYCISHKSASRMCVPIVYGNKNVLYGGVIHLVNYSLDEPLYRLWLQILEEFPIFESKSFSVLELLNFYRDKPVNLVMLSKIADGIANLCQGCCKQQKKYLAEEIFNDIKNLALDVVSV